jgi:PAS domain S-box-containing protein
MPSAKQPITILNVDDSPDKSELLSIILREAGYRVLTASNGPDGLEIAKQEIPHLVISDVSMPGMDGFELCRLMRTEEKLRSVPIMLVTALHKDTESLARGLAAGADEYLEAPFDPGRLIAKVARLIERKRTDEPLAILASIVENSEEAIIGKSLGGTITSWNFGAERIYGYEAAEVLGQNVYSLLIPTDRRKEIQGTLNAISRGVRVNRFQTQRLRKDGKLIDVSLTIAPIKDAQGRLTGASSIGRDITEALLAAAERERLINKLQDALAEVKTLQGILPICMHCKKIRDEEGAWTQLELYISEHTNANFTHGICGDCAKSMYPEIYEDLHPDNG